MKKFFKKTKFLPIFLFISIVLALFTLSTVPVGSSAAGTVDVFIDANNSVPIGQTLKLSVRIETNVGAMVDLGISYNINKL